MQKFVSDGCVLLLLFPSYKYKLKLMCNVNRRRTRGMQQNNIKDLKKKMVHLMKMLMLWKSSGTSIPVEKNGLSDAARAAVVSTFFCFP
jgi:hypothetical protein